MSVVEGGPKRAELENFLGGLSKTVKALVKRAVNLVNTGIASVRRAIPLGRLLDKLKRLIKPLLRRVLKFAIGRLPTRSSPRTDQRPVTQASRVTVGGWRRGGWCSLVSAGPGRRRAAGRAQSAGMMSWPGCGALSMRSLPDMVTFCF